MSEQIYTHQINTGDVVYKISNSDGEKVKSSINPSPKPHNITFLLNSQQGVCLSEEDGRLVIDMTGGLSPSDGAQHFINEMKRIAKANGVIVK